MRRLTNMVHRQINLTNTCCLFLRRDIDLIHQRFDLLKMRHNVVHIIARLLRERMARRNPLNGSGDQRIDLFCSAGAALRQRPHFGGDHGKAAPVLAGARGFYGCDQCQDIGLKCN